MDKKTIIKLAGILTVPLSVLVIGFFFLFPYLNEERYRQIISDFERSDSVVVTSQEPIALNQDSLKRQLKSIVEEKLKLQNEIDSLQLIRNELKVELDSLARTDKEIEKSKAINVGGKIETSHSKKENGQKPFPETKEAFTERIKGLLNLDKGDLSPIVNKMSDDQLLRLYEGGGTIQREKLLRSLKPDRAAKLMTEIML